MSNPDHAPGSSTGHVSVGLLGSDRARADVVRTFTTAHVSIVGFANGRTAIAGAITGLGSALVTADPVRLGEPDVLVVCTAVTLTPARGADTSAVAAAARTIAAGLRRGQLVLLTGPVPPGTTREILLPPLAASGLIPGRDFFLGYYSTPAEAGLVRVIGGLDEASTQAATAFFTHIRVDVTRVSSLEAAEVSGAVVPTVRAIRTAAANELKVACGRMGLDAEEILAAVGGGSLTPTARDRGQEPLLLMWGARRWGTSFRLLEVASEINLTVPTYVISQVADALNDAGKAVRGSRVALLGMADETDRDDPRGSPNFELLDLLLKKGAVVSYNDPRIPTLPQLRHRAAVEPIASQPLTPGYLEAQDCVLIVTAQAAYDYNFIVEHSRLVIDTRDATRGVTNGRAKIVRA